MSGRERGIRTPGGVTLNGFQDRRFQPLSHLPYITENLVAIWRRHPDSNWGIRALQAPALPLGYVALTPRWCPEPDLNRHGHNVRGILSPLCLPFHHPGKY